MFDARGGGGKDEDAIFCDADCDRDLSSGEGGIVLWDAERDNGLVFSDAECDSAGDCEDGVVLSDAERERAGDREDGVVLSDADRDRGGWSEGDTLGLFVAIDVKLGEFSEADVCLRTYLDGLSLGGGATAS